MAKMILMFSHSLSKEQREDAKERFSVEEFVNMPKELQKKFSSVPANLSGEELKDYAIPIKYWVDEKLDRNDVVLIQGEPGLCYHLVSYIKIYHRNRVCYATTKREVVEKTLEDGSVEKTSIFKHVRYRLY